MTRHIIAFLLGFLLDFILGDPNYFFHPIRLIGILIAKIEKRLRSFDKEKEKEKKSKKERVEFFQGILLVMLVLFFVVVITIVLLFFAYRLHPYIGMLVESIMTYQILAIKCLKVESMKVYQCLKNENLVQARKAVSMIVGRDTKDLNEENVIKAAVETVAENTSDGVIAPMLYLMIGGPILGFFYKAVNTMDSMIGYKNETYFYFGKAAAKLDDIVNFFPSRISAILMIIASFLAGSDFSGKDAWIIYKRDRKKHTSPNSAQTESVCAGALGIRLAGDSRYFGKIVKKPYIGERKREIEYEDIRRVNYLMYLTAWLCEIICILFMLIIFCL